MPHPQRDIFEHQINNLKDCIVAQLGHSIITKGDCDKLSESIETSVRKSVSVNTLRRFFDAMPTLSRPSSETLNILSQYCGFLDLRDFQRSVAQKTNAKSDLSLNGVNDLYQAFGDTRQFYQTLAWLVQLAFRDQNISFLKSFFQLDVLKEKFDYSIGEHKKVLNTLGAELQANPTQFDILIGHYASDPIAQTLYFECFVDYDFLPTRHYKAIELYSQHKMGSEAQLFSLCILFLHSFLLRDRASCSDLLRKINAIELPPDLHPFPLGRKMACNILFQFFYHGKIKESLIREIFAFEKQLPRNGSLGRNTPIYHTLVGEAFAWAGYHEEALSIIELAIESYNTDVNYHNQGTLSNLWITYAHSLLKSNRVQESESVFSKVNVDHFDVNTKNFTLMHYYKVSSELKKLSNPKLAASLERSSLEIAANYKFKFFEALYSA